MVSTGAAATASTLLTVAAVAAGTALVAGMASEATGDISFAKGKNKTGGQRKIRERNVRHPNGEEHSRRPKGNKPPKRVRGIGPIDPLRRFFEEDNDYEYGYWL